jgi:hypothetical protein
MTTTLHTRNPDPSFFVLSKRKSFKTLGHFAYQALIGSRIRFLRGTKFLIHEPFMSLALEQRE